MKSIELFNGLNGTVATREDLQAVIDVAKSEEQNHIASKLENVLSTNDDSRFDVELSENAFEIAPQSFLSGVFFEDETELETFGLAKPVTPSMVYDMITNKVIEMIKQSNEKDYTKKWKQTGYTIPFNFVSKKRYRGVNVVMLTMLQELENPFFLTFKQVQELGGKVKQGASGYEVVYYTKLYKIEDKERNLKKSDFNEKKVIDFKNQNGIENEVDYFPMLKYYNVFNGKDIEGIDFKLDTFKIGYIESDIKPHNDNKMPVAEAIIKNYPTPAPPLKHGGNGAFYSPSKDFVQMPKFESFETVQDYYRTLFHEFSHSTGHPKRLSRDFSGKFGSKPYALEELVAELGAIFLSAEAGIIWHNNKNHAAYLKSWNNALTHLKEDNKFVMKASTMAQKLTDYILQFDENGNPLYFKDVKLENTKIEVKKPKVVKKQAPKPTKKPAPKVAPKAPAVAKKVKRKSIKNVRAIN